MSLVGNENKQHSYVMFINLLSLLQSKVTQLNT